MKKRLLLGMTVAAGLLAGQTQAAQISWQQSLDMYTDGSGDFVNTNGTLKLAISGSADRTSTNTINGVPFVNIAVADINAGVTQNGVTLTSPIPDGHNTAFKRGSFSDSDIGTVIESGFWGATTVTLTGLTSNEWYMIQVMPNDARRNSTYVMGFSDGINDIATSTTLNTVGKCQLSNAPGEASGDSIIGYFQADSDTQAFDTNGSTTSGDTWNNGGRSQINGLQLRQLAEAPVITPNPPTEPAGVYSVIGNMEVTMKWSASTGDGDIDYLVKRSTDSGSGYVTIGSTNGTSFVDTTVATNETYYYVISATNEYGASSDSVEATGVGLPFDIIGNDPPSELVAKDNLFDNDIDTIWDRNIGGSYAGLDYGTNNALRIMSVAYTLRGENGGQWNPAVGLATDAVFEGANLPDFSDAATLFTIPSSVSHYPAVNTGVITDTTPYRYVRLRADDFGVCYFMAEVDFITENDVTAEGTSTEWLDSYYMIPGSNAGVYFADYADADYSDTDGDGLLAWEEFKLSGDPTDANSPAGVNGLYAWPEGILENVVRWDTSSLADIADGGGYIVYRSTDDSTYAAIGTASTNEYTDTAVTDGVTYYYKASVTNATYEHETVLSSSEMAAANQYQIFGVQINAGSNKDRWFYELFDRDGSTFMDDNAVGGYAGLDYGVGNGQAIEEVYFHLRGDSFGTGYNASYNIIVDGVTTNVSRAQYFVYGNTFEGSNDGANWTVLATITNMIPQHSAWNVLPVTDATTYQYVRYYPANGLKNFAMADVEFLTGSDYTAKGTPVLWLEENGLTAGDDEVDGDSDGHESWQEYLAYTDPNDSNSVLKVTSMSMTNGLVLTWQSVEGVSYSVVTNLDLVYGTPGTIATDLIGKDGETSYTGTVSGASTIFYEIGVE